VANKSPSATAAPAAAAASPAALIKGEQRPATLAEASPPYAASLAKMPEIEAELALQEKVVNGLSQVGPSLLSQAKAWLAGGAVAAKTARSSAEQLEEAKDRLAMLNSAHEMLAAQTAKLKVEAQTVFLRTRAGEHEQLVLGIADAMDSVKSAVSRRAAFLDDVRRSAEFPRDLTAMRIAEWRPDNRMMIRLPFIANFLRSLVAAAPVVKPLPPRDVG
jgi:hypothetical protein